MVRARAGARRRRHLAYLEDSETYHRVYERRRWSRPSWALDTLIAATGLFFQLRGMCRQRTSPAALAALVLGIAVLIAVPVSGIRVTCCGTP